MTKLWKDAGDKCERKRDRARTTPAHQAARTAPEITPDLMFMKNTILGARSRERRTAEAHKRSRRELREQ